MSLFNFGKKKETASCACRTAESEAKKSTNCSSTAERNISCVKILGAGCKSCHEMYENAKLAVSNMGLNIEVDYVTDMQKIISYGVTNLPALVVNEKAISQGKVLKAADIEKLLK
ncbi:MAG: thioredoxin family protein [Eubacteriales bacterium]